VRARRRAARARVPLESEREGDAILRDRGPREAAPADVVATRIQREPVGVEAHEELARRREDVGVAEGRAERVVRGVRLEDAERWALAQLLQMAAKLELDAGRLILE